MQRDCTWTESLHKEMYVDFRYYRIWLLGHRFQIQISATFFYPTYHSHGEASGKLDQGSSHHVSQRTLSTSALEIEDKIKFDINLRSSCLDCQFLSSCPIAEKRGTPKLDVLLGTYSSKALSKRCLV